MPMPIYTADNCTPAYHLRWSVALFARQRIPSVGTWLDQLTAAVELDGVRLLEHQLRSPDVHMFLISTKPPVEPSQIIWSVKGRLQHLIKASSPRAFRRNFAVTSVGHSRREVVEAYLADQLGHHRMADPAVEQQLEEFQLTFPDVDLSRPQNSSHGQYVHNLHLVLVNQNRWSQAHRDELEITRNAVCAVANTNGHRLSRISLLADHLHVAMGCDYATSPQDVALLYLNSLAYSHGMKDIYQYSYYVGTFGEYDMGAVWRGLR
jgi:REP element-mobilizing transposase RayT